MKAFISFCSLVKLHAEFVFDYIYPTCTCYLPAYPGSKLNQGVNLISHRMKVYKHVPNCVNFNTIKVYKHVHNCVNFHTIKVYKLALCCAAVRSLGSQYNNTFLFIQSYSKCCVYANQCGPKLWSGKSSCCLCSCSDKPQTEN